MQLKSLLAKVRSEEPGSPISELDGFDLIHDAETPAAMTDGSKRREDVPPADQPSVKRVSPNALLLDMVARQMLPLGRTPVSWCQFRMFRSQREMEHSQIVVM